MCALSRATHSHACSKSGTLRRGRTRNRVPAARTPRPRCVRVSSPLDAPPRVRQVRSGAAAGRSPSTRCGSALHAALQRVVAPVSARPRAPQLRPTLLAPLCGAVNTTPCSRLHPCGRRHRTYSRSILECTPVQPLLQGARRAAHTNTTCTCTSRRHHRRVREARVPASTHLYVFGRSWCQTQERFGFVHAQTSWSNTLELKANFVMRSETTGPCYNSSNVRPRV